MSLIAPVSPGLFTMNGCWISSKAFSVSNEMIQWFLPLSLFTCKLTSIDSNERLHAGNGSALLELLASEVLDPQMLQSLAAALVILWNLTGRPYC